MRFAVLIVYSLIGSLERGMGFCVRSGDWWAKESCLSHSFICMTRSWGSVTFPIILLSESALKKEVDRLSPGSLSGPELLLFSQNACSRRHHLYIDTASEGQWCHGWWQEEESLCSSGFFSNSCIPGHTKQGHWLLPPASFLGQTSGFWNFKDLTWLQEPESPAIPKDKIAITILHTTVNILFLTPILLLTPNYLHTISGRGVCILRSLRGVMHR